MLYVNVKDTKLVEQRLQLQLRPESLIIMTHKDVINIRGIIYYTHILHADAVMV